jgi:hypothetical protein
VKSVYAIPKNATMTLTMEAINYDDREKDIFLSLDYEYLLSRPSGYMDVGMGAINFDGCPGVFLCTTPRPAFASHLILQGPPRISQWT